MDLMGSLVPEREQARREPPESEPPGREPSRAEPERREPPAPNPSPMKAASAALAHRKILCGGLD